MAVIHLKDVPLETFPNGATYQTLVGDHEGSTPIRLGLQISKPGYSTGTHSHPYMEILTVIQGSGIAWMETQTEDVAISVGTTLVFPMHVKHGFRVSGSIPLHTYGIHLSPRRIVNYESDND